MYMKLGYSLNPKVTNIKGKNRGQRKGQITKLSLTNQEHAIFYKIVLLIILLFDVHFVIQGLKWQKLMSYPEIWEVESFIVTKEDKVTENIAKKWI